MTATLFDSAKSVQSQVESVQTSAGKMRGHHLDQFSCAGMISGKNTSSRPHTVKPQHLEQEVDHRLNLLNQNNAPTTTLE
jgi:hypothetical protein